MARAKFVVEDSFESIFRDLKRTGADAAVVMREELGVAVGEIIDTTPQSTGMAASGWSKAATALKSRHVPIKNGETYGNKKNFGAGIDTKLRVVRSAAWGRNMSKYEETVPFSALKRAIRTGDAPNRIDFIAANHVKHITFIEYGTSGNAKSHGKNSGEENGYWFKFKPLHIVRNAMRNMKQRIGPLFAKALKANIKRPKRYKRTVIA